MKFALVLTTVLAFGLSFADSLKVHVDGDAYLRFFRLNHIVLRQVATLKVSKGLICSEDDIPVSPEIKATDGALSVELDGTVYVSGKQVGRLVLAVLPQKASLTREGNYLYTDAKAVLKNPGEGNTPVVRGVAGESASNTESKPKRTGTKTSSSDKTSSGAAKISIAPNSEIENEEFFISDVATVRGPKNITDKIQGVSLGLNTIVGSKRALSAPMIVRCLLKAGFEASEFDIDCPSTATVTRIGQTIPGQDVDDQAIDAVRQQLGISGEIDPSRQCKDFLAPIGKVEYSSTSARVSSGVITITVSVKIDGKRYTDRMITMLPAAGTAQVKAYEKVTVRFQRNGAMLELSGTAKSNALAGQRVNVLIDMTGAIVTGILRENNVVEVRS